ncbi:MAG: Fe(2+) transporter permease subunit FeoB [Proteobacteria bacterium]|nr:Fe(2+) transporter permease subunit FeoB [Pseudomonadota bacterium]
MASTQAKNKQPAPLQIALVGNPNCGKTTLFNALTGATQHVGNWSGVTTESLSGHFWLGAKRMEVIDLPGTYTLTKPPLECPYDETITSSFLKDFSGQLINVVDAHHLERNLYLTLQLLEQNLPVVVALNRMDLMEKAGYQINIESLAKALGCKVVPLVARSGIGLESLKEIVAHQTSISGCKITYPPVVEQQIQLLENTCQAPRYQVVRWLEGELSEHSEIVNLAKQHILAQTDTDADVLIASSRYQFIDKIIALSRKTDKKEQRSRSQWGEMLDSIACHRYVGIPFFFAVMYALFFFAINIGGAFQDFFELSSNALFVEGFAELLSKLGAPAWLMALLVSGVGKGISTILTFIPVIGAMFLALAFLEDSGYMARAAFVIDRFMRTLGLPGKSFVPMIVGFGCNVPAIMGMRTLENKRDRILAVMMSPFMSCGARLAIFTVFVAAFFPVGGPNIVFLLYVIGIFMAVLTGLLLKKTLLKGEVAPLVLEMPDYQWPHGRSLWLHCWHRLRRFVVNAGKLILPVCIVIGVLNSISIKGQWLDEPNQNSILAVAGKALVPVFKPLGIEEENWPAAVGLLTGILAKEVVIGTLNSLYVEKAKDDTKPPFVLAASLRQALATIPANLAQLSRAWRNPIQANSPTEELNHHIYGEMVRRFNGQANAFAYLLFVLLYFPCVSATAAMVREVQKGWTLFSVCWTTGLAYAMAVIYYQCATFEDHPLTSSLWVLAWMSIGIGAVVGIRYYGKRYLPRLFPTPILLK